MFMQMSVASDTICIVDKWVYLEKWICDVDTSVKTQCDVEAEKRPNGSGGTKDGYVRILDRAVWGDPCGESL